MRSRQVWSGNLISPREPLARGYFVAPSQEKKIYKITLKIKVELKISLKRIKKKMSEKYHAHASDISQILFLK